MNKVVLLGRLGKAVTLRRTGSGKSVGMFPLAVDRRTPDGGCDWLTIVVWDKTAENCAKYLDKGSQVLVDGRIQARSYTDKDGSTKYTTEIIANTVEFTGSKNDKQRAAQKQEAAPQGAPNWDTMAQDNEIVPF